MSRVKTLNRKLFTTQQHQNFLLSERELQYKQFQTILSFKHVETIKYEDGSLYKGEISENGIRNGIGMLITVDNAIYMGKWKNDIYDEEGTYLYPDGERYEGEIMEGRKDGVGKMFYINGDVYEGEWIQDVREGNGEMVYANGDRYVGEWRDNQPFGEGTYYSGIKMTAQGQFNNLQLISGNVKIQNYEGQWKYGGPHGKGTYTFEDGSVYEGQWKNGEKQGHGQFRYVNGDFYQGSFRCGLKNGKGMYKYSTGDSYEGQFWNDYKHGYGVMRFINGDQYRGEWLKDLFHGNGVYTFSTKQSIKTVFSYGAAENSSRVLANIHQSPSLKTHHPQIAEHPPKTFTYSAIRTQKNYSNLLKSHKKTQSNINAKGNNFNAFPSNIKMNMNVKSMSQKNIL